MFEQEPQDRADRAWVGVPPRKTSRTSAPAWLITPSRYIVSYSVPGPNVLCAAARVGRAWGGSRDAAALLVAIPAQTAAPNGGPNHTFGLRREPASSP